MFVHSAAKHLRLRFNEFDVNLVVHQRNGRHALKINTFGITSIYEVLLGFGKRSTSETKGDGVEKEKFALFVFGSNKSTILF